MNNSYLPKKIESAFVIVTKWINYFHYVERSDYLYHSAFAEIFPKAEMSLKRLIKF